MAKPQAALPLIDEIGALLSDERQAILSGSFEALPELGSRKTELFEALARAPRDEPRLRDIAVSLGRNQRLLAAAISGVREAAHRVGALQAAEGGFSTYTESGARAPVGSARTGLEKRY